jgi:prepilin-type N-terminal cleavage/methylation domain-containing protein
MRRAFTLIEMMAVIGILAILVALISGAASYVFRESSESETRASMGVIMLAVDAYYDIYEADPSINKANPAMPNAYPPKGDLWVSYLVGDKAAIAYKSRIKSATGPILLKLNNSAFRQDDGGTWRVYDGFDKPMEFDPSGGIGGRPVIISAGADNDFSTKSDNLYSDDVERSE